MKKRLSLLIISISLTFLQIEADSSKVYLVSDAHLDTQWNWDVQTTIKDHIWKTLNQNIFLINQYPDYIFNFEGGIKYAWMKEYYPREYEIMKGLIKKGRWHISGASWDANDVNVPSIESQIRNIMLGQNFYRSEFGVESTDIFLPDCFGFGWTLPTIANHCSLIGFSSQKLDWRTHPFYGKSKHPFKIGLWQGVDGSRIMLAHGYDYNQRWNNADLSDEAKLKELAEESPIHTVYRYYGTGDTGGSPTIASVESMIKGINGNGPLKIMSVESDRLYKDYQPYSSHPELPVFDGELLMDVHGTGCYTSQAAMKLYNRQNEMLGDAAERGAVIADLFAGASYPGNALTDAWKRFIWHQFHDDLTGTSIPRAYEFSWNDELITLKQFSDVLTDASASVARVLDTDVNGIPVVLFNPLAYENTDVIELSLPMETYPKNIKVFNSKDIQVPSQIAGYENGILKLLIEAKVPSVGYTVYGIRYSGKGKRENLSERNIKTLENSVYSIVFDNNGDICSIKDKRNGKELVKPGKTVRQVIFKENKSYSWPAWEILKETLDSTPVGIEDGVEVTLSENGALRKTMKITKAYGESRFTQYVSLYEGELADRIDFKNEVDWATTNALLKSEFPLNINNEKATYDLGIGVIERGNNTTTAYEVPAREWVDLSDISGDYGVTILSDSKYGWDKPDNNTMRLSLIHTPETRNNYSYQNRQDYGHHEFTYSLIGHKGGLNRNYAVKSGEKLNQKIKAFATDTHKGISKELSLIQTDIPNVSVKSLKKVEDGKGYIVRIYETSGKPASGKINFNKNITNAYKADGTEKNLSAADFTNESLTINIPANGIGTYRVELESAPEMKYNHKAIPLPYNSKAMTWNEFRFNGDFNNGYSYAAELIPESLNTGRSQFVLSPKSERNALVCNGDTLRLPSGNWKKLHLLMAATSEDKDFNVDITIGKSNNKMTVPSYTGFIGQWGHTGHTKGYLKPQRIGHIGTHRHSSTKDEPYEFTYMFDYVLDIPKGAKEVILPKNKNVALFAASVSENGMKDVTPLSPLFSTANRYNEISDCKDETARDENLMDGSPIEIKLWENGSAPTSNEINPEAENMSNMDWVTYVSEPTMTVFPAEKPNGMALLMCPGGAYYGLAMLHEGADMAKDLNSLGITLAVLKYRTPNGHHEVPADDARQALRILRRSADKWGINPDRIGIGGASAGGHLASTVATHPMDEESKVNFQVLIYPVISMQEALTHQGSRENLLGKNPSKELIEFYSNELHVTSNTPKAFICATVDDNIVPVKNTYEYYDALTSKDVEAEMRIYPKGGHGWAYRPAQMPYHTQWLNDLKAWLSSLYPYNKGN